MKNNTNNNGEYSPNSVSLFRNSKTGQFSTSISGNNTGSEYRTKTNGSERIIYVNKRK